MFINNIEEELNNIYEKSIVPTLKLDEDRASNMNWGHYPREDLTYKQMEDICSFDQYKNILESNDMPVRGYLDGKVMPIKNEIEKYSSRGSTRNDTDGGTIRNISAGYNEKTNKKLPFRYDIPIDPEAGDIVINIYNNLKQIIEKSQYPLDTDVIKFSNYPMWYPAPGYMGWHTNHNKPGTRIYLVWNEEDGNEFRYIDWDGKMKIVMSMKQQD